MEDAKGNLFALGEDGLVIPSSSKDACFMYFITVSREQKIEERIKNMAADPGTFLMDGRDTWNWRQKVYNSKLNHRILGNIPFVFAWTGIIIGGGFIVKKLHNKFAKKNRNVEDAEQEVTASVTTTNNKTDKEATVRCRRDQY